MIKPSLKKSIGAGILMVSILFSGMTGTIHAASAKPNAPKLPLAANFQLKDINGKTVSLSDYKGKVVLVNFWATWCPPCRMEIPHFIELQNQYKDKGFIILGLAGDDEGAKVVKPFAEKMKINYPVLIQDEQVADNYGGIVGIPTSFLIDTKGQIIKKYIGYTETSVIIKDMKPLLPVKEEKKETKSPAKVKSTKGK
jgi:cytochrome c biogenesis protein CcmG/thiol:disulfide interchange protein DsbE